MTERPAVDVVVPFKGSESSLRDLLRRLDGLRVRPGDTVTVVDNRPPGASSSVEDPRLIRSPDRQSPSVARNDGARLGTAEWIVFIDTDVEAAPDLIDQYFESGQPGDDVGILAGAIHDQELVPGSNGSAAARYAYLRQPMAQRNTRAQLGPFAKTANAAMRRCAFEAVRGFREDLRFGEDVDLCYRMCNAGWRLEYRDQAVVEHHAHATVRELLAQQSRHGAGTAWLSREYPGFAPPFRWSSLFVSLVRGSVRGAWACLRGNRDRAVVEVLDPLTALAFHLGRFRPHRVEQSRRT